MDFGTTQKYVWSRLAYNTNELTIQISSFDSSSMLQNEQA